MLAGGAAAQTEPPPRADWNLVRALPEGRKVEVRLEQCRRIVCKMLRSGDGAATVRRGTARPPAPRGPRQRPVRVAPKRGRHDGGGLSCAGGDPDRRVVGLHPLLGAAIEVHLTGGQPDGAGLESHS